MEVGMHRPRNVGWARAAALLYGDWGTSKAYVIGAAFLAAGYASFPIILAVMGSLLLVADLTVTASLSGWSAMAYFQVPKDHIALATVGLILAVGAVNRS